jgi:hypothetical protein
MAELNLADEFRSAQVAWSPPCTFLGGVIAHFKR